MKGMAGVLGPRLTLATLISRLLRRFHVAFEQRQDVVRQGAPVGLRQRLQPPAQMRRQPEREWHRARLLRHIGHPNLLSCQVTALDSGYPLECK